MSALPLMVICSLKSRTISVLARGVSVSLSGFWGLVKYWYTTGPLLSAVLTVTFLTSTE